MRTSSPLPPQLRGRSFSTSEAEQLGVTKRRIRARDLDRPFQGIRMPAGVDRTQLNLCRAYASRMPDGQFFSHVTAANLYGLPLPTKLEGESVLHVSAPGIDHAPRAKGIVGHRAGSEAPRTVMLDGLPVGEPVWTWCQLATVLSLDELIVMGDALVRRQKPFATMEGLARAVAEFNGHRGSRRLREAFESVRPGVDSPKETEVRLIIVEAGLPEPMVNATIRNSHGAFIALGDLVYPEYRILIEYDGAHHFAGDEQMYKDIDRLDNVMEEKWRVVRLNKTHLRRRAIVVAKVRTALLAAGWRA